MIFKFDNIIIFICICQYFFVLLCVEKKVLTINIQNLIMARIVPVDPVGAMHGKVSSRSKVSYRTKNGKTFDYVLENPRNKFSEKEKGLHRSFGEISKRASQIAKDPALAAPYMAAFEAQKETGQKSLYQFVVTQLMREEMGKK